MKTITHTPGPWEAVPTVSSHRKHFFGRAKNEEYYIGVLMSGSRNDLAIFRANFQLIATAPELLSALEKLAHEAERRAGVPKAIIADARSVIAKARGQ